MNKTPIASDRIALMQTFIRIVEAGSLSAAASQLGTTQPTISRRLQTLEQLLGLRLMLRTTHALTLTSDGERCYAHAKELTETWAAMQAELRGAQDAPSGLLRVMVPHAFGQGQLLAPLAEYMRRYPEVQVEWTLQEQRVDLVAEGLDCAIRVGPVHEPNVVALHLADVQRFVVAAPSLLQGAPPPTEIEALHALPWVSLNQYYRNEVCLSHIQDGRTHRFSIHPRMGTDNLYALRNAMLAGMGVGIASAWIVADDLRQGRLIKLTPQWQASSLPVHLLYPYARYYPARLRAFIEIIRAAMPGMEGMTATTPG